LQKNCSFARSLLGNSMIYALLQKICFQFFNLCGRNTFLPYSSMSS
jgi:hypothetical protein